MAIGDHGHRRSWDWAAVTGTAGAQSQDEEVPQQGPDVAGAPASAAQPTPPESPSKLRRASQSLPPRLCIPDVGEHGDAGLPAEGDPDGAGGRHEADRPAPERGPADAGEARDGGAGEARGGGAGARARGGGAGDGGAADAVATMLGGPQDPGVRRAGLPRSDADAPVVRCFPAYMWPGLCRAQSADVVENACGDDERSAS